MKCCVCNREREPFKVIVLTEEERVAVRGMGQEPLDEYGYCKPCWNIATSKHEGAQLLKGLLQYQLQRDGVRNAEELATKAQQFILRKAAPKPVS